MQLNITFRGIDSAEALKSHVRGRVEHLEKYLDRAVESHAVLSLERYLNHADITIHAGPYVLRGRAKSEDMFKSIDEAGDKIEKQLIRYKGRLRANKHRAREEVHLGRTARHEVIEIPTPEVQEAEAESWSQGPKVVRSNEFPIPQISVDEAAMQMDLMNNDFLVFMNSKTKAANVLYRRGDGHYGLIETPAPSTAK